MRRSANLFPAALLLIAVVSIGGRASADPVVIHNSDNEDVVVTITDNNSPNGVVIANERPVDANGNFLISATPDVNGDYDLHWKVQDAGRTKTEEGDCRETPVFACRIDLFTAP
jgi:hypothetical protein